MVRRVGASEWLAEVIRHAGTAYADMQLTHRFEDYTAEERAAALGIVFAELEASLIVNQAWQAVIVEELRELGLDPDDDDV